MLLLSTLELWAPNYQYGVKIDKFNRSPHGPWGFKIICSPVCYLYILYLPIKYWILIDCETLIKINITLWIMKPRPTKWWNLATGDIAWRRVILKKIDCAEFMRVRFTIDSDLRLMSIWIYGVRNTNSNIHLTGIVLKPNLM